ncbi:MAG: hypothetical protein GSR84_02815 [Desulfurococcales archaeon]|nr:hypothetical protein [Desulfurococcales archaeon]
MYARERVVRVRGRGWLPQLYRAYYSLKPPLGEPPEITRREFAFQPFETDTYVRHKSFTSLEELRAYLEENHPRQAYYSIALYEVPDAGSMEEKGWTGSELLVDIDPEPGEGCTVREGIPGDDCLEKAYKEAQRAASILERDMGLKPRIYYTGHKGFHIKATSPEILTLSREARRRIAVYLTASDLDPAKIFPQPRKGVSPATPSREDPGWRGRIAEILGLEAGTSIEEALGEEWRDRITSSVQGWRPGVDHQVTQDPTRLTRVPGTLNGKAGLIAQEATHGFTPEPRRLSPFRGTLEVVASTSISGVEVLGFEVELRRGRREEAPAWLAVLLESKGLLEGAWGEVVVRRPRSLPGA